MKYIKAFFLFWYEFIVGDDWVVAVGIVLALFGTDRLKRSGINSWWLTPVGVVALLAISLWRQTRRRTLKPPT